MGARVGTTRRGKVVRHEVGQRADTGAVPVHQDARRLVRHKQHLVLVDDVKGLRRTRLLHSFPVLLMRFGFTILSARRCIFLNQQVTAVRSAQQPATPSLAEPKSHIELGSVPRGHPRQ